MRTYAESIGMPVTDYRGLLTQARDGTLSEQDHNRLWRACGPWSSCAVGCQDYRIVRKPLHEWDECGPLDPELRRLGGSFPSCILQRDWEGALSTLNQIEARAAELVAEIEAMEAFKPVLEVKVTEAEPTPDPIVSETVRALLALCQNPNLNHSAFAREFLEALRT